MKCRVVFALEGAENSATVEKADRKIGLECSPIGAREKLTLSGGREIALLSPSEPVACADVPELLRWAPKLMKSIGAEAGEKFSLFYVSENQVVQVTPQQETERSIFVTRDCYASCVAHAAPHSGQFTCTEAAPGWMQENIALLGDIQKALVSDLVKAG